MGELLSKDNLGKAAGNVRRIGRFLYPRVAWRPTAAGADALRSADGAAADLLRTFDPYLDALGVQVPAFSPPPGDPLPSAELDGSRLAKIAGFLVRLRDWFAARAGQEVEKGGELHLGQMYSELQGIREVLQAILSRVEPEPPPAAAMAPDREEDAAASEPSPAPPPPPSPTTRPDSTSGRTSTVVSHSDRLSLEDTEAVPLLQAFKGETELTPHARELLAEFLERNGISYSSYQHHKFEAEVERRLHMVPPGQLLVIKIGEYGGAPKPFFSYVARERQQKEGQQMEDA